jgi:hypothetical protein
LIPIVLAALLLVSLLVSLVVAALAARTERRREHANRIWIDRQVYQAERKLHEVASNAFSSMMDVARHERDDDWTP